MRFKKIIIVNILIVLVTLTSCVRSRDIEELGIVMTTGIDMEGEKVLLTHEVVVPKSNISNRSEDKGNVQYVQSRGDTIIDALRNATLVFDRKLFLAHSRVLILGEEFAKRGVGDLMNFYVSDNEPRESTILVVAKDSKAYELMGISGGLSDTPGSYLFDLLDNYSVNLKTRKFTLTEYMRYFLQGENPVSPIVELIQELEIDKGKEEATKDALNVSGGAVFRKDKLLGYYNGDEMKGFNFIVDEFENGLIVFETPDELVKNNKFIATSGKYTVVEVKNSSTKNRIEIIDDKLHLTIDVKVDGTLIEDTKGLNISDKNILEAVNATCSNKVKDYITMTMDKAQKEFRLDTFSIGNLVHIKYPHLWREISDEWEGMFPDLEYEVNVETDLIRSGLINTPINIKIEENCLKENK